MFFPDVERFLLRRGSHKLLELRVHFLPQESQSRQKLAGNRIGRCEGVQFGLTDFVLVGGLGAAGDGTPDADVGFLSIFAVLRQRFAGDAVYVPVEFVNVSKTIALI